MKSYKFDNYMFGLVLLPPVLPLLLFWIINNRVTNTMWDPSSERKKKKCLNFFKMEIWRLYLRSSYGFCVYYKVLIAHNKDVVRKSHVIVGMSIDIKYDLHCGAYAGRVYGFIMFDKLQTTENSQLQ